MTKIGPSSSEGPFRVSSDQRAGFDRVRPVSRAGMSSDLLGPRAQIQRKPVHAVDTGKLKSTSGARRWSDGIPASRKVHRQEVAQTDRRLGNGLLSASEAAAQEKTVDLAPCRRSTSRPVPMAGFEEAET